MQHPESRRIGYARVFIIMCLFGLVVVTLPQAHAQAVFEAEVNTSANVRTGAGTSHRILGSVPAGTVMPVIGEQGRWYIVDVSEFGFAQSRGYIHGSLVNLRELVVPMTPATNAPGPEIISDSPRRTLTSPLSEEQLSDGQRRDIEQRRIMLQLDEAGSLLHRGDGSIESMYKLNWRGWSVYQDETRLTESEVFELGGRPDLASAAQRYRNNNTLLLAGGIAAFAGGFAWSYSEASEGDVGAGSIVGGILMAGGAYVASVTAFRRMRRNWAPVSQVAPVVDEYNKYLLESIYTEDDV